MYFFWSDVRCSMLDETPKKSFDYLSSIHIYSGSSTKKSPSIRSRTEKKNVCATFPNLPLVGQNRSSGGRLNRQIRRETCSVRCWKKMKIRFFQAEPNKDFQNLFEKFTFGRTSRVLWEVDQDKKCRIKRLRSIDRLCRVWWDPWGNW